ncbi:MAG: glycerol-3-phosphate dehydrogenase [Rhodobacteraceae bacterium CG17_big_fil_post_rev_8_21_14_2_50_65_11]|nr:MAG: glycerol-3-phosphate dehydrogenase [Rhodobacteraceae bacterium CG17_big_fil_post_rev_8_21_14_2_50_65_11]
MVHDFLIIGGGIAGISAGARLSHLGSVLLLEAEPALAYHASGRSAALFEAQYGQPATVALNRASKDYHMTANGGVLGPRGLMMLAGPGEEDTLARDIAAMQLAPITVDEAIARIPALNRDHIRAAAYHAAAWDLDTDLLLGNFVREIRANGGQIRTGAAVTAIRRNAGLWHVTAGAEAVVARQIVNAAGAWVDEVATRAGVEPLGHRPLRRSMARMPAPGGHDPASWPMIIGAGETWYAKPDAGKWIVSPAEEDPVDAPHDAWADDMVLAEGIARYQPFVTEDVTRVETTWAGLRTFSPDRTLVLGRDAAEPDFIWCSGQGGYGFQTAPAASQLLADLIAGRAPALPPEIVAALSPERFG